MDDQEEEKQEPEVEEKEETNEEEPEESKDTSQDIPKSSGGMSSKLKDLQKQYLEIITELFEKHSKECIQKAFDVADQNGGPLGSTIHIILNDILNNFRMKLNEELGLGKKDEEECGGGCSNCSSCGNKVGVSPMSSGIDSDSIIGFSNLPLKMEEKECECSDECGDDCECCCHKKPEEKKEKTVKESVQRLLDSKTKLELLYEEMFKNRK